MTKLQLKELVAQLDALQVPDAALVKFMKSVDNARHDIAPFVFKIEGQDAEYSVDAQGHWAPAVSQAHAVILKEA